MARRYSGKQTIALVLALALPGCGGGMERTSAAPLSTSTTFIEPPAGALEGDVTGASSHNRVAKVGGASADAVASASTAVSRATDQAVDGTLVRRDTEGGFSGGRISASSFSGDGSRLTKLTGAEVIGPVPNATHAQTADVADNAKQAAAANTAELAVTATNALNARQAISAKTADLATNAKSATAAISAQLATSARTADLATSATTATTAASATLLAGRAPSLGATADTIALRGPTGELRASTFWGDGSHLTNVPLTGPAGGDLAGTYPSPVIAPGAVTSSKLAPGAVTSSSLAPGAIGDVQISNSANINPSKLASGANGEILMTVNGVPAWMAPAAPPPGSVLQMVAMSDLPDRMTTSPTFTPTGASLTVTPRSSQSNLLVECSFSSLVWISIDFNTLGQYQIYETTGTPTPVGATATLSAMLASYGAASAAPCTVRALLPNQEAGTPRSFALYYQALGRGPNTTVHVSGIVCSIAELASGIHTTASTGDTPGVSHRP